MKFISWIITVIVILICVSFAVSNRVDVTVDLWPFNYVLTSPLYVMTLGAFFCGFLFGAFMFWIASLKLRWDKHKLIKQVDKLKSSQ